jgi:predicted PurR-regulated permease PerM
MKKYRKYVEKSIEIFFKYFVAKAVSSLILAILTIIVLGLIGTKHFIIIGLIVGMFNMIPYLGSIISIMIAGIISVLTGGLSQMFFTLFAIFVLQQIEGAFISTKLMGDALDLSPLYVFLIVLIGGLLFGVFGIVLAVPIAAIVKFIYKDRRKEYY